MFDMKAPKSLWHFAAVLLIFTGILSMVGCSEESGTSIKAVNSSPLPDSSPAIQQDAVKNTGNNDLNLRQPEKKTSTVRRLKKTLQNESVTSFVYGKHNSRTVKRTAYLTFDDGPSRNNTPQNLDTLKKYGIKATFFVLPQKDIDDIYKRILKEGHEFGIHSYSHDYRILYGMEEYNFRLDLNMAENFLKDKFNYSTFLYRFPGGTMGKTRKLLDSRMKILKEKGYDYIDWDVSDGDADMSEMGKKVDVLVNNVLQRTVWMDSAVILMHDSEDKTATVEALPRIIQGLRKQGFDFDLLTEVTQ